MKKDLNIEERANAYYLALGRAREEYLDGIQPVKEAIERIFPEIKKSDDTKIREALIELVKDNEKSGYTLINNVSTSSMLNWLEKQLSWTS